MASAPLAIILAAGKGKRMESDLPKVLVPVCGRPMIRYVLDAVRAAGVERMVVVVGYRADLVRQELAGEPGVEFVEQTEQLGTGHAVMMCREQLDGHDGPVLIVAGDSPMVQVSSLRALLAEFAAQRPACLLGTATKPNPTGLGRIVRDANGEFPAIVEEKDATPDQRAITEVNLSTYVFRPDALLVGARAVDGQQCPRRVLPDRLSRCPESGGRTRRRPLRAAAVRGAEHQYAGGTGGRGSGNEENDE